MEREPPALTDLGPQRPLALKKEVVNVNSQSEGRKSLKRRRAGSKDNLADRIVARNLELRRSGSEETRRKKMRKKKKKKKKHGRGEESSESGDSSKSSSSSYSDEKELMAPIRKKADRKPGAVMEELLAHARPLLSEREAGEGRGSGSTRAETEVKLTLFFQLFWTDKFASRPRNLHELYLLVRCSDLLQQGRISEVADALAGRIMALESLEVAASSGSWSTAKYLEVETMDSGNLARPETLLAAQKHARLVAKAEQGWASWEAKAKDTKVKKVGQPLGRGKAKEKERKGSPGGKPGTRRRRRRRTRRRPTPRRRSEGATGSGRCRALRCWL